MCLLHFLALTKKNENKTAQLEIHRVRAASIKQAPLRGNRLMQHHFLYFLAYTIGQHEDYAMSVDILFIDRHHASAISGVNRTTQRIYHGQREVAVAVFMTEIWSPLATITKPDSSAATDEIADGSVAPYS